MGMVTEMRLRDAGEGGERFNYRGMHRYLMTLFPARKGTVLAEKETVIAFLDILRQTSRDHSFEVYAYCFLPDRLVMIIRGKSEEADMKEFLSAFRVNSTVALEARLGTPVWGRKYQERVLRRMEQTRTAAELIFRMPVKAGLAPRPAAYAFQGSFVLPGIEAPARSPSAKRRPISRARAGGGPPRRRPSR